jgi:hypothetical protein
MLHASEAVKAKKRSWWLAPTAMDDRNSGLIDEQGGTC